MFGQYPLDVAGLGWQAQLGFHVDDDLSGLREQQLHRVAGLTAINLIKSTLF